MIDNKSQSRDLDKVVIRLSEGMRPWIAEQAKKNMRSTNAQIVWMLQQQIEAAKAKTRVT